jgi:hypothetical protein
MQYSITKTPTLDITDVKLIEVINTKYLLVKSNQVFKFENVIANIINRSRVLRSNKEEMKWIETHIGATIDAGFCGYLFWKVVITPYAESQIQGDKLMALETISRLLNSSCQLQCYPSPAGNYYSGTNQTELNPDIIVCI